MDAFESFTEKFAVIVPVYNEQDTIEDTVLRLEALDLPYLVVDDCSTDQTSKIIYLKCIPNLRQPKNQGKGAAVRMGAQYAADMGYEWVLILDGDGQFLEEDIIKMDNALLWHGHEYEIFIGNRLENAKTMPKIRYLTNKIMSGIISFFSGQKIPDTQCGLKLIHTSVFATTKCKGNRMEWDSEVLIKAGRKGYKIMSVPVNCIYKEGRKSHIRPIRDLFRFLKVLFI